MTAARPGDWVEIFVVLLVPGERAPGLPPDTAAVPLTMRVRGVAREGGELGQTVAIRTQAGRGLRGVLVAVQPAFNPSFGECAPELIETRRRLKELMAGGRAP